MYGVFSSLCKIFLAPLVKILFIKEIKGLENIPQRNFILVSNHQSYIDVLIDGCICTPRRFHFIGQTDGWKGLSNYLIKGFYFLAGVIPIDRKKEESRKKAFQEAIRILEKRDILIIYPEGTRSTTGKIQEGKLGMAKIFLKTGVPILPVGIKGTFELLPPKGKLKIKRIVEVNIGKLLFFDKELKESEKLDENSMEYLQIAQQITDNIMKNIADLAQ
jgi:1-acyl-sn-glycerol-3-phosphate acyltransferase